MATSYGGRYSKPLGCSSHAGGGLYEDFGIEVMQPQVAHTYFDDYDSDTEIANYVITTITSGSAGIVQDAANGVLRLEETVADRGLGSVQFADADASSEGIATPASGRTIMAEFRVTCNRWSDCDWFVGLGETDTTFMSSAGVILPNGGDNHIGFQHLQAGDGTPILTVAGTAVSHRETDSDGDFDSWGQATTALTANTYYRFGVRIEGTDQVRFYIDGVPVTGWHTMAFPFDGGMTITYCMIANGSAVDFDVDYALVVATR